MLRYIVIYVVFTNVFAKETYNNFPFNNVNETITHHVNQFEKEKVNLDQNFEIPQQFDQFHSTTSVAADKDEYNQGSYSKNSNLGEKFSKFGSPKNIWSDVCANAGCVRGLVEKGRLKPYEAFYGIPYAEPPVKELRLQNPIPHKGWDGFWDATNPKSDCVQRNSYLYTQPIVGSEDCLYLNIYRPLNATKLPVLVFIHGGRLLCTSSSPDEVGPEYFMDNGQVILVTLNYRLGMLGFLCSGDEVVKGNFGLKDQQLALEWIAANIEAFGGDPSSITLAGQSAGALSVTLHMMNPESSSLFHRSILMSGSGITPWAFGYDWALKFRLSAKYSGMQNWNTATTEEVAEYLNQLHALNFVVALDEMELFVATPTTPLRPCIEGDWEGAFLKDDPRKIWAEGRFAQKPIFIGTTSADGTFIAPIPTNHTRLQIFNENLQEFLPIQLDFDPQHVNDVMNFYLGKNYIDDTNVRSYYQMFGDRTLFHPLIKLVNQYRSYADVQQNPIFIYEFGFTSPFTFLKYSTGKNVNLGASHIDDLFYLFTMSAYFPIFKANSPEGLMVDTYVKTIVSFATKGKVKAWTQFEPCTSNIRGPFCDRQIFRRYNRTNPHSVIVSVSDKINQRMVEFWDNIDITPNNDIDVPFIIRV